MYTILDRSASHGGRRFCGKEPPKNLPLKIFSPNGVYSPLCILSPIYFFRNKDSAYNIRADAAPVWSPKRGVADFIQSHKDYLACISVFPYTGVWRQIAVDLRAILRETRARDNSGLYPVRASVWAPNRGFTFAEKSRKDAARCRELISLPNSILPYEKRHIRTNAPFFITLLLLTL